tara:strand:- start:934 stop:1995 length:1062 start_codon:yes stop_codon:yes gene_type:complete
MLHINHISSKDVHLSDYDDIIDVRSPSEFGEDHLPDAINLPVLSNSEREEVGTIYKQVNPFEARRRGAALVSYNISEHLKDYFVDKKKDYSPLIYCWRGGERSRSLATILESVGWRPSLLEGGYQGYRKHVIQSFNDILKNDLSFKIISGLTGSGKTKLLMHLESLGCQTIDLEGLASHRGSALGEESNNDQPSQKMFERLLYEKFLTLNDKIPVFLESESSRIGDLQIPSNFWTMMKNSDVWEIETERKFRVDFLLNEYIHFIEDKELLKTKLSKIRHLKSDRVYDKWISMIDDGDYKAFVRSILEDHYDAAYISSRQKTYSSAAVKVFNINEINDVSLRNLAEQIKASVPS